MNLQKLYYGFVLVRIFGLFYWFGISTVEHIQKPDFGLIYYEVT